MHSGQINPDNSSIDGEKQKQLDREVREMVSALTHRLADLQQVHKPGSSHHEQDEDDRGVRIITLAGSNTGATMRSELDDKSTPPHGSEHEHEHEQEHDALGTCVNSNFQAFNNSLMLDGSYSTNDPGVHVVISEFFEQKPNKHGKKGKKKDKESSKSDQHSD